MVNITRSFSLPALRYSSPREGEACVLHDVGVRVDAGAAIEAKDMAAIANGLETLKGLLGPFLQEAWAHRMLIARGDAHALAYARTHKDELPRSYVMLSCPFDAEGLAVYLLKRVAFEQSFNSQLTISSVQVSLDPGTSYLARVQSQQERTIGGEACTPLGPDHPMAQARQATKFVLPNSKSKNPGVSS